jgi:hypothetical protein
MSCFFVKELSFQAGTLPPGVEARAGVRYALCATSISEQEPPQAMKVKATEPAVDKDVHFGDSATTLPARLAGRVCGPDAPLG